jgi:Clostripain family
MQLVWKLLSRLIRCLPKNMAGLDSAADPSACRQPVRSSQKGDETMASVSSAAVSNPDTDDRKWTVMVFMGADTVAGNEPLGDAADADLEEIGSVAKTDALDVFVEVHHTQAETVRHYFGTKAAILPKKPVPGSDAEPALIKFIEEAVEDSGHREKDHSMLVLWGHAYDFAFARGRARTGVVDSIDFVELRGLLQHLQGRIQTKYRERFKDVAVQPPSLDIVAFDACDVATVEMACQLHPFAKYLLGSEIGIPMPGWPYDRILDRLTNTKGRRMVPGEYGSYVVRRFCESYTAETPVSLTFLDLSLADRLRECAEDLATALSTAIDDPDYRDRIIDLFQRSQTGEGRPYVDVAELCLSLRRQISDPFVIAAATSLGDLLLSPGEKVATRSGTDSGPDAIQRPLIVEHGRNAGALARLNGLSLYAPHVAGGEFESVRGIYDQFVFAKDTLWSTLVHLLAGLS